MLLGLRRCALNHLNALGDSAVQAIVAGEPLVADCERVRRPPGRLLSDARSSCTCSTCCRSAVSRCWASRTPCGASSWPSTA